VKRAVRYALYGLAALAVLVVAAVLVFVELVDRPRLAAEIQARLSHAVRGEVRWRDFGVSIIPAPRARVTALHVETAAATLSADEVTVALKLWPLFRGRAEIAALEIARPALSMTVVPEASKPQEAQSARAQDPLAGYRAALSALAEALQEFAPQTLVAIDDAGVKVSIEGMPPLELGQLRLRGRTAADGVELDASAISPYWSAMKLAGRLRYADLSSSAELHLTRLKGKAWLDWLLKPTGVGVDFAEVDLDIGFRGHPAKTLEAEVSGRAKTLDVTRGAQRVTASPVALNTTVVADADQVLVKLDRLSAGATRLGRGTLTYAAKAGRVDGDVGFQLDLPQALDYARAFAPQPLERIASAGGTLRGRIKPTLQGADWRLAATIESSDASLELKDIPGPMRLTAASIAADSRSVQAERVAVSLPAGELLVSSARYGLRDGAVAAASDFDLDLERTLALVRAAAPKLDLSIVESAAGKVRGKASGTWNGKSWSAAVDMARSDAQLKLKPLPAPLRVSRATVRAAPQRITVERADASLLDSTASASATIKGAEVRAAVSQATIGPKLVEWIWQTHAIAPRFEPKAPIHLVVPHLGWSGKSLEVRGEARFDAGPLVFTDVRWRPDALDVRRASVKDGRSDATVALRANGGVIDGSYAGTLDSRTLGALLRNAAAPAGAVKGDLRFTFDRDHPQAIRAEGNLQGDDIDLTWLAGKPAKLARLDLSADGDGVHVAEATLDWAGQLASLRGELKRTAAGPVLDAAIESPGLVVDALLPEKTDAAARPAGKSSPFPLPVTGRIAVRSKFVRYGTYRVEPLAATVRLERERAHVEVTEALVCGLALPLTLDVKPSGYAAAVQIAAQKQTLEETAKCLSHDDLLITGPMDLRLDVRTEGQLEDLLQNLKGTVSADVRNGTVTKFALLGNILSMQNVVALAMEGGPKLGADAFPFRQLSAKGHFDQGRLYIDEGVFHSNAIGLGANGWISLTDFQSRLTVLVAPLALVDEAVRKLPVLGYVVGGTFTSLPVGVSGDIRDPSVVPLGPRAITDEMMGLLGRTLSLPARVVPGKD